MLDPTHYIFVSISRDIRWGMKLQLSPLLFNGRNSKLFHFNLTSKVRQFVSAKPVIL